MTYRSVQVERVLLTNHEARLTKYSALVDWGEGGGGGAWITYLYHMMLICEGVGDGEGGTSRDRKDRALCWKIFQGGVVFLKAQLKKNEIMQNLK